MENTSLREKGLKESSGYMIVNMGKMELIISGITEAVDADDKTFFIKAYGIVLSFYVLIWKFLFPFLGGQLFVDFGLLAGPVLVLSLTRVSIFIVNKSGGFIANLVYGGFGSAHRTQRELSLVELERAKHHKKTEHYREALALVNEILEKDSDFYDALFFKAQLLWEGFGNASASCVYLKKVMEFVPDKNNHLHRWALSLHESIVGKEKPALQLGGPARTIEHATFENDAESNSVYDLPDPWYQEMRHYSGSMSGIAEQWRKERDEIESITRKVKFIERAVVAVFVVYMFLAVPVYLHQK